MFIAMKSAVWSLLFLTSAFFAQAAPPTVLSGSVTREIVSLRGTPPLGGRQTIFSRKVVIVQSSDGGDLAVLQLPPRKGTALEAFVVRGLKRQSDLGQKNHTVTHLSGIGEFRIPPADGTFVSTATVIARFDGDLVKPGVQVQGTLLIQDEGKYFSDVTPLPGGVSPVLAPFLGHSSQTLRFRALRDVKLAALVALAPSFDEAVQLLEKKILGVNDPILFTSLREWAVPTP